MNWRPEKGWDSKKIVSEVLTSEEIVDGMMASQKLVEAGADAMLEALEKVGQYKTPCEELILRPDDESDLGGLIKTQIAGWLVFIPDA